jgi:hypothetical protein
MCNQVAGVEKHMVSTRNRAVCSVLKLCVPCTDLLSSCLGALSSFGN